MNIDTAHPMIKITSAKLAAAKMRDLRGSPSPKGQKIVASTGLKVEQNFNYKPRGP